MNVLEKFSKLQYALIHCQYEPSEEDIKHEQLMDRLKNPHNESHKPIIRDRMEIIIDLKTDYINKIFKF